MDGSLVAIQLNHGMEKVLFDLFYFTSIGKKDDNKAFIFSLKNPHGVEPTRLLKRKGSTEAISCDPRFGPIFGGSTDHDIFVDEKYNEEDYSCTENDGTNGYECHPRYKNSFFTNTNMANERNWFTVVDYEVFGIDYEHEYNINKLCKHPDVIMKYIQTKDISEESLRQIHNKTELLKDLDAIRCKDSAIRVKISQYRYNSLSVLLPKSSIVENQYDEYLREWIGDYKWKLLYRASEHNYTAKSFHDYCDDKGSTLVMIKSSKGFIFGGYTTQSWKLDRRNIINSIYSSSVF